MTDPVRPIRPALRLAAAALPGLALLGCAGNGPPPLAADAVPGPGLYQLPPDAVPDGTLRAVMPRGAGPVRGTLSTNAQRLPVILEGLGVAAPAPARVEVNGQVFGLGRTDQVVGTYRPVGDGAAVGAQVTLTGGLQLGNDELVVMRLWPGREGQVLTAAPDGVRLLLGR